MDYTLLKRPSAWIPLVMSLAALTLVLVNLALFGIAYQADEGAVAHIWQLLMAGQLIFTAYFAVIWLPSVPKKALVVLGIQIVAVIVACAPVIYFQL